MLHFYLPPRVLPTPLDPPWFILLLCKSWAVRRTLVHRVIVSLILVPCRARGSAIAVRRILVISPESSLHAHKVVPVLQLLKCEDTFPLFVPLNAHRESHRLVPHSFLIYREIDRIYFRRTIFPLLGHNVSNGPTSICFTTNFGLVGARTPFNPNKLDRLISGKIFESVLDIL
jgi:hypothetical protein